MSLRSCRCFLLFKTLLSPIREEYKYLITITNYLLFSFLPFFFWPFSQTSLSVFILFNSSGYPNHLGFFFLFVFSFFLSLSKIHVVGPSLGLTNQVCCSVQKREVDQGELILDTGFPVCMFCVVWLTPCSDKAKIWFPHRFSSSTLFYGCK